MFEKLLSPLTTATSLGVATRDLVMSVGAIITVLGVLGFLDEEQVKGLTEQVPTLLTALGAVAWAGVSIYRIVTKSSSDKAAEAGKKIDAELPAASPVVIRTPEGQSDIIVPAK